ncbi:MAG: hypothetical protein H0U57_01440 [Tatlockia sp.]|nr:hypothetical protein [Tatlockia sp.]
MKFRAELINPRTFRGAKENLKKGLNSLGLKIPKEAQKLYKNIKSPLENIVLDLLVLKNNYWILPLTKDIHPLRIEEAKVCIEDLRLIIKDAISSLSIEELLTVNFETNRSKRTNLIAFLGEIGEVSLFKAAFRKLLVQLSDEDLQSLFLILQHSYEGSQLSEALGLASSLIHRGHYCYIAIADWMLATLYQEGRAHDFISLASNATDNLPEEMELKKSELETAWTIERYKKDKWDIRPKQTSFDEAEFKAKAERDFNQYVIEANYENLFLKCLYNFMNSPKSSPNEIRARFLWTLIESNPLLVAAGALVLVGAIALTVGTMGIAGFTLLAGSAAAVGLACAGGITLGAGVGLGAVGFFSSCVKEAPNEVEVNDNFYVGLV